jgi:hypothetical protein
MLRRERQSLFSVYLKTHTHTVDNIERKSNKDDPIRLSLARIHTCRRLKRSQVIRAPHTHTQMIHPKNIRVQQRPTSESKWVEHITPPPTHQRAILFYPMNSFRIPRILQVITHLLWPIRIFLKGRSYVVRPQHVRSPTPPVGSCLFLHTSTLAGGHWAVVAISKCETTDEKYKIRRRTRSTGAPN